MTQKDKDELREEKAILLKEVGDLYFTLCLFSDKQKTESQEVQHERDRISKVCDKFEVFMAELKETIKDW